MQTIKISNTDVWIYQHQVQRLFFVSSFCFVFFKWNCLVIVVLIESESRAMVMEWSESEWKSTYACENKFCLAAYKNMFTWMATKAINSMVGD